MIGELLDIVCKLLELPPEQNPTGKKPVDAAEVSATLRKMRAARIAILLKIAAFVLLACFLLLIAVWIFK